MKHSTKFLEKEDLLNMYFQGINSVIVNVIVSRDEWNYLRKDATPLSEDETMFAADIKKIFDNIRDHDSFSEFPVVGVTLEGLAASLPYSYNGNTHQYGIVLHNDFFTDEKSGIDLGKLQIFVKADLLTEESRDSQLGFIREYLNDLELPEDRVEEVMRHAEETISLTS